MTWTPFRNPVKLPSATPRPGDAGARHPPALRSGAPFQGLWVAISIGLAFLAVLFSSIFVKGYSAFLQTSIKANVFLDPAVIDPPQPARARIA